MSGSWVVQYPQREFALEHTGYPISLAQWGGHLGYRLAGKEHCEPLNMRPGTGGMDHDRVILVTEGVHFTIQLTLEVASQARVKATLQNCSGQDLSLDRLVVTISQVGLGHRKGRVSFFKNGYQSWTETRSFRAEDREMVPFLRTMSVQQNNPRNLSSQKQGEFTSDMLAVIGNLDEKLFLLLGQGKGFQQFFYIRGGLAVDPLASPKLTLVYDFGGQLLPAEGRIDLDEVAILTDDHANRIQDRYFDLISVERASSQALPTGWCSWYYYYAQISERDVNENLDVIHSRQVNWRYLLLDDGYEYAVGDWLSANDRFPSGLGPLADRVRAAGLTPGLWIAPFIARSNSHLYREYYEWLLKDEDGKPVLAGWNPTWGLEGRFYGLDTTHPGFQERLREWIRTIVHTWGYRYLKLDFAYGASLYGVAYDPSLSAAERLKLGYRVIRETAGEDVFILGCGSPLSPAIGMVNAMRIGPDVAPYWFAKYRYYLTRDPHAVCTKFAIRNVLNRCQMHRKLWINDPDCLLLRDTDTKLTADERMSLVNAAIITGGMYVISDRLARLSLETWRWMEEIDRLVRHCDKGRPWALDYMEREIPEVVYNSQGHLAVFNFADRIVHKKVPLSAYLEGILSELSRFVDVWSGDSFLLTQGVLDLGPMKPHASRLLRLEQM